jgi:hypothetical protein
VWTILTYIAAHSNLDHLGMRSWNQIVNVGSSNEVMHGVLYDGPRGAARYIVGDPGLVLQEESCPDFDSGDPQRLLETAQWVFGQYPAQRYGLILWSHGTGWRPEEIRQVAQQARGDDVVGQAEATTRSSRPGSLVLFRSSLAAILRENDLQERAILFDDGTGHSLDTLELQGVVDDIHQVTGQPLDLLGMDACLMANLEVAYQVRHAVRYLVASEELVPGHSWPYDTIFGALRTDSGRSPAELATSVVRHYTSYYRAHPPQVGDVTKVALDLSEVNRLAQAVASLASALSEGMDDHTDLLWSVQQKTSVKESRNHRRKPNKFDYHLWDLGTLADGLVVSDGASIAVHQAAAAVREGLAAGGPLVLAEGHSGSWFEDIGGVSIYLMPPGQRMSPYYDNLAFSQDTAWSDMLKAYHDY